MKRLYRTKSVEVTAEQFRGASSGIDAWCFPFVGWVLKFDDGYVPVSVGDWIVDYPDESTEVVSDREFQEEFEPCAPTTATPN